VSVSFPPGIVAGLVQRFGWSLAFLYVHDGPVDFS
jgi:hypothetical protein